MQSELHAIALPMIMFCVQSMSSDEDSEDGGDDVWDPQHATPWRLRQSKRGSAHGSSRQDSIKSNLQVQANAGSVTLNTADDYLPSPLRHADINQFDVIQNASLPVLISSLKLYCQTCQTRISCLLR